MQPVVMAMSRSGTILVVGYDDGVVAIWSSSSPEPIERDLGLRARLVDLVVSPDGRTIAAGSERGEVLLLGVDRDAPFVHVGGFSSSLRGLAFSPDGRTLAIAFSQSVMLWRVKKREIQIEGSPRMKGTRIESAQFSSDGTELVLVMKLDGPDWRWIARSWSSANLLLTSEWVSSELPIDDVSCTADGTRLFYTTESGISAADREGSPHTLPFSLPIEWGSYVAIEADAWRAVVAADPQWMELLDFEDGRRLAGCSHAPFGRIKLLDLSSDGTLVAAGLSDASVLLWQVD